MADEIGFENGSNSNFQGLVTLTLTLDPAIRHTVVHHSSTSTCIPYFIEIEETFCGRTYGRTDGHFSPSNIIRSTFGSRPKNATTSSRSHRMTSLARCAPLLCVKIVSNLNGSRTAVESCTHARGHESVTLSFSQGLCEIKIYFDNFLQANTRVDLQPAT